MRKLLCIPAMLLLVLVFTASMAAADGVAIEVVNKTGKQLPVKLVITSMVGDKDITRTADVGGTVQFSKAETAHDPKSFPVGWKLYFHETCTALIAIEDNNQCGPQYTECAKVDGLGPCSYRYTVVK